MNKKVLTLDNVNLKLGNGDMKTKILDSVCLDVFQSEILGLVGSTGSGKTMLAKTIMGLLSKKTTHKTGEIVFHKNPQTNNKANNLQFGIEASMIFQEPTKSLNPVQSIGKQFRLVLKKRFGYSLKKCNRVIRDWFEKTQLIPPDNFLERYPHQLSGGQMQRVMISIAMAVRPRVLIADEITTSLDSNLKYEILDLLILLINESKTSVLLISHDLDLVRRYCNRVSIIKKGCIIETNKTKSLFENPKHSHTKKIIESHFSTKDKPRFEKTKERQPLITIKNISKTYSANGAQVVALNKINLNILEGEALGIIGESGSGKSTLVKILLQILDQDSGEIKLWNKSGEATNHTKPNQKFGVVFQDSYSSLNPKMKIFESLTEPMRLKGLNDIEVVNKKIKRIIRQTGLKEKFLYRYPNELSGGQRQRVSIARSLIIKPRFLILDEPTSSLDVYVQKKIIKLIKKIKKDKKLTIMLISHDLRSMIGLVDRIAVLYKGQIIEQAKTSDILYNPNEVYTRNLVSTIVN